MASNTLKWEPSKLLLTDRQKKELELETQTKDLETKISDLEGKGLTKQLAANMLNSGYNSTDKLNVAGTDARIADAINDYIQTKGGFI